MSFKSEILLFLIIAFTDIKCDNNYTELYSKLLNGHNNFVPPNNGNISVSLSMELTNLLQIDTRNQEVTFTAVLNLYWTDTTLSWSQKDFPLVNQVTLPSAKIWTPDIILWNSAGDFKSIQRSGGDLFISANGQVHWPSFGNFKTSCTIDVTYYPFDQQTCIVKFGPVDKSIQLRLHNNQNTVDLNYYYMSVLWTIIEAPAYLNVYQTLDEAFPTENDITYYLTVGRKTHWLSEVYPLLVFSIMTIIPAVVTRSMEKVLLQVFCMAGLFAVYNDIMTKLPPTSFVTPLVSKYIVALILCNLIHLTLATIISNCRKEFFDWIAHQISRISCVDKRKSDEKEVEDKQHIEIEKMGDHLLNVTERQKNVCGDKIVAICNKIILILLTLAVVISTLCFLFGYPKQSFKGIA